MSRYNTFKYGDGTKYGASTVPELLWTFIVAWDGTWNGDNEANRMIDFSLSRGRDHLLAPLGAGFEHYQPGTVTAVFDNEDGRYNPYNTSSPLYPNVTPGKFVRVAVLDGTNNYSLMHGIIADIQPYREGNRDLVVITVNDGLQWLLDRNTKIGLLQNVSWGIIGANILVDTLWPDDPIWSYTFSIVGDSHFRYYWNWGVNALQAMYEAQDAENGLFLHTRTGDVIFRSKAFTHSDTTVITEGEILRDVTVPQPWEVVRNRAKVYCYPKILDAVNDKVWSLQDIPLLVAGGTLVVDVRFRWLQWEVCGSNIAFDMTANSSADGSGTNLTANIDLSFGDDFGNADIGNGTTITLYNRGTTDAYIISLSTVGDAIYTPYTTIYQANDPTSEATYGSRTFTLNTPWIEDTDYAQAYADWIVAQFKDPKVMPTIRIEDRPSLQYALDLYRNRIQLQLPTLGIDDYFRIGKIEHKWLRQNGQAVRTTYKLEPYLEIFSP